jgi:hypothetical protein
MPVYTWSQTAATNATADSTINWAEGQAPSTVNDSARAMMAAGAKWRDDISATITTAGSATAYTVTSNSIFDSLAHMNGQIVAFVPHASNTGSATLSVDGLTAKPIRFAPGVETVANTLILGATYVTTYNNADGAFYLHNMGANSPAGYGIFHVDLNNADAGQLAGVAAKIAFNHEVFDRDGVFDAVTTSRFQPLKPGYYHIQLQTYVTNTGTTTFSEPVIYLNGSIYAVGTFVGGSVANAAISIGSVSALLSMNGSTDYIEGWIAPGAGTNPTLKGDVTGTYMHGWRVSA